MQCKDGLFGALPRPEPAIFLHLVLDAASAPLEGFGVTFNLPLGDIRSGPLPCLMTLMTEEDSSFEQQKASCLVIFRPKKDFKLRIRHKNEAQRVTEETL